MLNFEKASKILEDHFANLTDEEFITNLKEYCPRVFAKDKILDETEQRSSVLETITNLRSQQSSFKTPQEIDAEILEEKSASSLNNEDNTMTLAKVLPGARQLSAAEKLKLIRILAEDLDTADDISPLEPFQTYDLPTPYDNFGAAVVLMELLNQSKIDRSQSID